jgi:hypothetical protein
MEEEIKLVEKDEEKVEEKEIKEIKEIKKEKKEIKEIDLNQIINEEKKDKKLKCKICRNTLATFSELEFHDTGAKKKNFEKKVVLFLLNKRVIINLII